MNYKFSSKAQSDLINIWEFTLENWSIDQADRYYNLIIDKVKDICKKPDLGRSYNHVRQNYWGVNVKSHIVFYKIGKEEIEVIRILHQRMDLESRLNRIKQKSTQK
jgi:toxin ParE1/3/4